MTTKSANIDKFVRRYRTGAYGGIIATIPLQHIEETKKIFGKGFPNKGDYRGNGEADFHFKTNTFGYSKLSNSIKDRRKWQ